MSCTATIRHPIAYFYCICTVGVQKNCTPIDFAPSSFVPGQNTFQLSCRGPKRTLQLWCFGDTRPLRGLEVIALLVHWALRVLL